MQKWPIPIIFYIAFSCPLCFTLCHWVDLPAPSSLLPFDPRYKSRNWTWECLLADSSCTPDRNVPIHREEQNNSALASWSWHAWLYESILNWAVLLLYAKIACVFLVFFLLIWLLVLYLLPELEPLAPLCLLTLCPLRRRSFITVALSTSWLTASCFYLCFLLSQIAGGASAALHHWSLQ